MKNFIKDTIFIIIFLILFHFCTNILVLKGNTYGSDILSFYNLKKNSLDLVFYGSSHSYATFSPDIIEQETGLVSYNFATQQQPIYITYHYMIETLKYQKPKYFVLETNMLAVDSDYTEEGVVRDAIDKLRFSTNKINVIKASVQNKKDYLSYYLNIIKYHTRYNELNKADIITGITKKGITNRGYKALEPDKSIIINNKDILKIKDTQEISNKNKIYLDKIISLAQENNITLIFVKSPCTLTEENIKKFNWVKKYAFNNDITYIDYNEKIEELGLKNGDYYDGGHLSYIGAEKVSKDFSIFLKNNFSQN